MSHTIIKPLSPGAGWTSLGIAPPRVTLGYEGEVFIHRAFALSAISAVEVAKDKDGIDRGPEYHISIAKQTGAGPARCSAEEAAYALKCFGLEGAEEDNHVPGGVVRNFWRPVAEPMIGLDCACKDTEHVVIEGDYEHRPLPTEPT